MTESDTSCSPEHGNGLSSISHHCILHAVQAIAPRKGISEVRRRGGGKEREGCLFEGGGMLHFYEPLNSLCQQPGHKARQTTKLHVNSLFYVWYNIYTLQLRLKYRHLLLNNCVFSHLCSATAPVRVTQHQVLLQGTRSTRSKLVKRETPVYNRGGTGPADRHPELLLGSNQRAQFHQHH